MTIFLVGCKNLSSLQHKWPRLGQKDLRVFRKNKQLFLRLNVVTVTLMLIQLELPQLGDSNCTRIKFFDPPFLNYEHLKYRSCYGNEETTVYAHAHISCINRDKF